MADIISGGGSFGGGGATGTWDTPTLIESAKTASTGTPASKVKVEQPTSVTTSFDVERFRSSFKKGLSSPVRFLCKLSGLPKSLIGKYKESDVVHNLSMHTNKSQIPDMNFQTFDYSYFGIPFKYPHENMTSDLSVSVICSADMWERQFFTEWQKTIGDYDHPDKGPTLLMGFQDDFTTDIEVLVFNEEGKLQKTYVFTKAWPMQMSLVDVDWESKDSTITFNVTFAHGYWGVK